MYVTEFCDSILFVFKKGRQEKFRVSNGLHENSSNRQKVSSSEKLLLLSFYALYMSLVVICSASYYIYVVNGLQKLNIYKKLFYLKLLRL